ncbi:MAG: enoyl-CoA hydratase-related protein [Solirubrobacteraceae bacterium]
MAETPAVHLELGRGYVVARLARPPANPLGPVVLAGLEAAIDAAEETEAHALVIASSLPEFFAAGADIKLMQSLDVEGFMAYGTHMRQVFARIDAMSAISIAAIDGLALGGGLELAMACTIRIGSARASLGLPEVKLGLIPGAGGTQRLPRIIGRSRALDILLSGRQVPAAEAHVIGLLDRLVPDGDAEPIALEIAAGLGSASDAALASVRRCVDVAFTEDLESGIAFEADEENALFAGADAREGIAAFVERRVPAFNRAES